MTDQLLAVVSLTVAVLVFFVVLLIAEWKGWW